VGELHKRGVPIVAGTDISVPGHSLHRELELYVQAGFTPLEAIQAATIVPARIMHLDKEVGTIESRRSSKGATGSTTRDRGAHFGEPRHGAAATRWLAVAKRQSSNES
jgi:hypothetical protein